MNGLLFRDRNRVAEVHRSPAFADVIAVPGWNLHAHVALDHGLAAEARVEGEARSHIQPVKLIIVGFGKIFIAAGHDHVTSGASATPSAGVLELNAEIERHIQNRFGLAMFVVRQLAVLELDGLVEISKRDLGHTFILAASAIPVFAILVVHVSRIGKAHRRGDRISDQDAVRNRRSGANRTA